jgi:hypothetical protein
VIADRKVVHLVPAFNRCAERCIDHQHTGGDAFQSLDLGAEHQHRRGSARPKSNPHRHPFARRRPLNAVSINLNEHVLGMMDLLRRTLGETISITASLAPDLWVVQSDVSEIENAALNLAINARDAMPAGGTLMIETRNMVIDDRHVAEDIGLAPGGYVRLSVSDTGEGIKPEILVCLGATAAQALLGRSFRVTKDRGRVVQSPLARYVLATVHPSSILRAPDDTRAREMSRFVDDLEQVAKILARVERQGVRRAG